MKNFFKAFFKSLGVGIVSAIIARMSIFPIVGLLHNRWIKVISWDDAGASYFWIGKVVGSIVFIFFMFKYLRSYGWKTAYAIAGVASSAIFLFVIGIVFSSL
jgi:hypothetical protein